MNGFPIFQYISQGEYLDAVTYVIGAMVVIFLVLPFHEYAHGWMSNQLGDPTARYAGRLSLNPMRHIDWLGAALIMFVGFGWAKPVPVNTRYYKNPKRDMAITAVAGPVSNLLMGLMAMVLANGALKIAIETNQFTYSYESATFVVNPVFSVLYNLFYIIASINVGLAVFNLLPVPPLDGSRLLTALLPNHLYYKIMQYEQYIMMGLFLLLFIGVLDGPLILLRSYAMNGIEWLAGLPFGYS
ncbi:MAG: site-2 protease family protein [Clostridia bacterium]|nr:site-2 protease family protein [Clostridia bacterium]